MLTAEWPLSAPRTKLECDDCCIGDTARNGYEKLAWENQARRRTVREQSALGVGDATFCHVDTTAAVEDPALGPDLTRLWRDGSDKRNLELERRTADALFEHRLDGKAHAAIEKSRREAAVHRAPWVEVSACWIQRDGDATAFGLHHIIAKGLRDRVQGQRPADKALDPLLSAIQGELHAINKRSDMKLLFALALALNLIAIWLFGRLNIKSAWLDVLEAVVVFAIIGGTIYSVVRQKRSVAARHGLICSVCGYQPSVFMILSAATTQHCQKCKSRLSVI